MPSPQRNAQLDAWMQQHGTEVPVGQRTIGHYLVQRLDAAEIPCSKQQAYHYFARWRKAQARKRTRTAPPERSQDKMYESILLAKAALTQVESQYTELKAQLKEILG